MLQEWSSGETRLVLHVPRSSWAGKRQVVIIIMFVCIFIVNFIIIVIITITGAEGICEHQQGGHITNSSLPQVGASGPVWLP